MSSRTVESDEKPASGAFQDTFDMITILDMIVNTVIPKWSHYFLKEIEVLLLILIASKTFAFGHFFIAQTYVFRLYI